MKLPDVDTCFFCEVLGADDHWSLIAQCSHTATFLNGRQFEVGQCVVVPRRHVPTILELNEQECSAVMTAARRISAVMMEMFEPDGILLYQNNGEASGQEVPHFHLHVVPRQPGSDWGLGPPHIARLEKRPAKLDHEVTTPEKQETAERLRRESRTFVPAQSSE